MYPDHEGNLAGDTSPSRGQPNKRVPIRTIETPRTPRSQGGGRYECRFHASQNHKDPERGKTTRAPPSRGATSLMRTFCSHFSSPARRRSDAHVWQPPQLSSPSTLWCACSALLPIDALITHVLQPPQLSFPSMLWLRTFYSRLSSPPCRRSDCTRSAAASALLYVVCRVWIQFNLTFRRKDCGRLYYIYGSWPKKLNNNDID